MSIDINDIWIIINACIISITCGLLGCFLILRRMAMVGDAISHAVLPGIVISFLVFNGRYSFAMVMGAVLFGMIATIMIETLKKNNLQNDAAIGLSYTFLFSLGVILVSLFTGKVDIDNECILYGEIAYTALNKSTFFGIWDVPESIQITFIVLVLIVLFIIKGFKGLYITSFNPEYAATIGISITLWNYSLMSAVSISTVTAFESVGAILVVAFLVLPAATAYLLTHKIKQMLILSVLIGILSSVLGYILSVLINSSISATMAVVCGVFFIIALRYHQLAKKMNK